MSHVVLRIENLKIRWVVTLMWMEPSKRAMQFSWCGLHCFATLLIFFIWENLLWMRLHNDTNLNFVMCANASLERWNLYSIYIYIQGRSIFIYIIYYIYRLLVRLGQDYQYWLSECCFRLDRPGAYPGQMDLWFAASQLLQWSICFSCVFTMGCSLCILECKVLVHALFPRNMTREQFVDACMLAGTEYCLTFPYLQVDQATWPTKEKPQAGARSY